MVSANLMLRETLEWTSVPFRSIEEEAKMLILFCGSVKPDAHGILFFQW